LTQGSVVLSSSWEQSTHLTLVLPLHI
jgi:hypothetical protein